MLSRIQPVLRVLLLALSASPVHAEPSPRELSPPTSVPNRDFDVGAGIWDITGPAAENMMAGYASIGQTTKGIHQRLFSRAFVIATPLTTPAYNNKRVVFVSADINQMSQAIKSAVVDKLQARYGLGVYTDANVMLSATHTHVGPGGYAKYALYDSYTLGFQKQNFDAIVEGIYQSIVMAHEQLARACIRKNGGALTGAGVNRSPEAFSENAEYDSPIRPLETNERMTLLKFQSANQVACAGDELGLINWFAVHTTSFGNDNQLISGDNKGWGSYRAEEWKGATYGGARSGDFVAAFAQSNAGDVSPNVCDYRVGDGCGGGNDFVDNIVSGDKQFNFTKNLYDTATDSQRLTNELDYRHAYVRMDKVRITPAWNPVGNVNGLGLPETCSAAIGMSFAAGAEDGRSNIPGFYEGMTVGSITTDPDVLIREFANYLGAKTLDAILGGPDLPPHGLDTCQWPKPVLLPTGTMAPNPWTPQTLPVQLFRIGSLAIVGIPAEVTTMAGNRLRTTIKAQLPGVTEVVIAGLANSYSGYVTTPEEYDVQHYEGASTHFGRMTLPAYRQIAGMLAQDLNSHTYTFASLPRPADLCGTGTTLPCFNLQTGVIQDDAPWVLGWDFGDVRQDAAGPYVSGDTVVVWFQAGHPKNNLLLNQPDSFATVQRLTSTGTWEDVYEDTHPSVQYSWGRWDPIFDPPPSDIIDFSELEYTCLACSQVRVKWKVPPTAAPGKYRIRHRGHWKQPFTGIISEYSNESSNFRVN